MPKLKLILATNNAHKAAEIGEIFRCTRLKDTDMELLTQRDAGITADVEETGVTYRENAELKARAVWEAAKAKGLRAYVLAEDSGLEVEALNNEPGIYTKRWAGEDATDADRIRFLLEKLEAFPEPQQRRARYVCVACVISPEGEASYFRGEVRGEILHTPSGEGGFGYDPVFGYMGRTFAEISEQEKNDFSHRGFAMRAVAEYFADLFEEEQQL